jgi:hypothetical protein
MSSMATPMDDAAFWKLVSRIDREALGDGDEEGAVEPLVAALTALPPPQIEAFDEALARKLHAIDGRAYADAAGESGGSGDGFLYARCFVVAQGRKHYEDVLADPRLMPTSVDDWCEALLFVTQQAYEAATGNEWTYDASVDIETGANAELWK